MAHSVVPGNISHNFNRASHAVVNSVSHNLAKGPMRGALQPGLAITNTPYSNIYAPIGRGIHHYKPEHYRALRGTTVGNRRRKK